MIAFIRLCCKKVWELLNLQGWASILRISGSTNLTCNRSKLIICWSTLLACRQNCPVIGICFSKSLSLVGFRNVFHHLCQSGRSDCSSLAPVLIPTEHIYLFLCRYKDSYLHGASIGAFKLLPILASVNKVLLTTPPLRASLLSHSLRLLKSAHTWEKNVGKRH